MARYVLKSRIVDMFEIVKVRPILLYHTYALTIKEGVTTTVQDIGIPEVGDFLTHDGTLRCLIKKKFMKHFKEVE